MKTLRPLRIAFFSIHPAPYRDPFLNELATRPEVSLQVYTYLREDRGHGFWGLPPPRYSNVHLQRRSWIPDCLQLHSATSQVVLGGQHDLYVFPGSAIRASVTGMVLSALLGRRYVYNADSIARGQDRGKLLGAMRDFLIQRAAFLFVPGRASETYFSRQFNFPLSRICQGCYTLDGSYIRSALGRARARSAAIRATLGIRDQDEMFLMVANMIPERHYPVTAAGFDEMARRHPTARFVMVGDGPESELMRQKARGSLSLIVRPGCNFEEMLDYYAAADAYVHGGQEPASTALIIGAIAGLPLVSSFAVGHAHDCLEHGVSGVVVPDHESVDDWAAAFESMIEKKPQWRAMGANAAAKSQCFATEDIVDAFVQCALVACR